MADYLKIAGRVSTIANDGVTAEAQEIKDLRKDKFQQDINQESDEHFAQIDSELDTPSSGVKARLSTLEAQVAFSGEFQAENTPQGIISESGKIATANAVRGAIDTKVGYFECNTAANTARKDITAPGFVLTAGGCVKIKMLNANTIANASLKIGTTDEKPLYYNGERVSAQNTWDANEVIEVYYDGTNYYANNVAGGAGDGVFDVSAKYPTSGVEGGNTYTLQGAINVLDSNLSANRKKGGMSIKFIQSSDNKYVQYRYMGTATTGSPNPFTNPANWQGVDDEPTAGSENLVKSGGVKAELNQLGQDINVSNEFYGIVKTTPEYTVISDKQIRTNGAVYDATGAAYTSLILLHKGDIIYVNAIGINYLTSIISIKGSANDYISVVGYSDGISEYSWQAPFDCYVSISYKTSYTPTIVVYSSTEHVDVDDLKLKADSIKLVKNTINPSVFANAIVNASTGIGTLNSSYALYGPFEIHRGDLLYYSTVFNASGLGIVCELGPGSDVTKIFFDVLVESTSEKLYTGTLFFDHDCCVVIACVTGADISVNIYKSNILSPNYYNREQYYNVVKTIPEYSENIGASDKDTFIKRTNAILHAYTTPIHLNAGDLLIVRCRQNDSYNAIALCTKNGILYKTILAGLNAEEEKTYTYRAYNDCYVCVGYRAIQNSSRQFKRSIEIYSSTQAADISKRFSYGNDFFRLFYSNCICIGDSVTYGAIDDYPRVPDAEWAHNNLSYPTKLAKLTGWDVVNAGSSGYSAKDWYEDTFNRNIGFSHWDYTEYDIALIELGLNGGFSDTLDTDTFDGTLWQPDTIYSVGDKVLYNGIGKTCSEAHTSGSTFDESKWDNAYLTYADTNTGCYCKIIEGIRIANPQIALIILVSSWLRESFSDAAKVLYQIAERYNLPVIDLDLDYPINLGDIKYHGIRPVSPYDSIDRVHFNPIGYLAKAGSIYMQLMQVIADNAKDLNNIKTY